VPRGAQLEIFTFKEGLLSRVAHDLRLHVEGLEVPRLEPGSPRVTVEIPISRLRVDGAIRKERLDPGALSSADLSQIESNLRDILSADLHPKISFDGEIHQRGEDRWQLGGELHLAGRTRSIEIVLRPRGSQWRGSVDLVPSRWGIAPYRAMAGAIRLKDLVRVELSLERDALVGPR
jgi:polyisoprenoid-binding protein YceI